METHSVGVKMPLLWLWFLLSSTFVFHLSADELLGSDIYSNDLENLMQDTGHNYKLVCLFYFFNFFSFTQVNFGNQLLK
jgi:hypothetical protein